VFFRTSPYRAQDAQHQVQAITPLLRPSADTPCLVRAAVASVQQGFRPGFNYAKAGVFLVDLQAASHQQGELDLSGAGRPGAASAKDRSALMAAMDHLNRRFGRDAVRVGSTTLASHDRDLRRWATRQERRSPRYTTRWEEMVVVRA
jgi:DNA polymerase V